MPPRVFKVAKRWRELIKFLSDVKWDLVALLMFVPLVSESITRYLGKEPLLHRLGSLEEPVIEMVLLAGIGVFMSVRGAQRLRAERERESLIERLQEKNQDLEMMNHTISHDLKSPLLTVNGLLRWVEKDAFGGNTERLKTNMQVICRATARMEELIDQLSQFVRIGQSGEEMEELDFGNVVREATDLVSGRLLERGVDLRIDENLPVVRANRSLLLQVLQNLIENAIKFMGDQPHPKIEIASRRASLGAVLYVRDNGVGIDPSCQERVFDLFSRVGDGGVEGCGLGLALVKRAVEVQGGRVWVESEGSGQGATFCFSLPANDPNGRAR